MDMSYKNEKETHLSPHLWYWKFISFNIFLDYIIFMELKWYGKSITNLTVHVAFNGIWHFPCWHRTPCHLQAYNGISEQPRSTLQPCSVEAQAARWRPRLVCGGLDCSVDALAARWRPKPPPGNCGGLLPGNWRPMLLCGGLDCSVEAQAALWRPGLSVETQAVRWNPGLLGGDVGCSVEAQAAGWRPRLLGGGLGCPVKPIAIQKTCDIQV